MRPLPTLCLSTLASLMVPLACTNAADETVHNGARTTVAGGQNSVKRVSPLATVRGGSAAGDSSAETSDDGGPVIRVRWEPIPAADTTPESARDFAGPAQGVGELPTLQALEEQPVNPEPVESGCLVSCIRRFCVNFLPCSPVGRQIRGLRRISMSCIDFEMSRGRGLGCGLALVWRRSAARVPARSGWKN